MDRDLAGHDPEAIISFLFHLRAIQNRPSTEKAVNSHSLFQSVGELDQLREFARGASLEVNQLQPGVMHGVLAHADLGQSSVHMNRFSLSARGRGSLSADRWTYVAFPRSQRPIQFPGP